MTGPIRGFFVPYTLAPSTGFRRGLELQPPFVGLPQCPDEEEDPAAPSQASGLRTGGRAAQPAPQAEDRRSHVNRR